MDDIEMLDSFIEHFGVKGMHWGVHSTDYPGATRKVNREAKKDASEFARAKMFYGEGAGTRRKLIKAKVASNAKVKPGYQEAFDHHVANQDLGKHADRAISERRRKDAKASIGKTARGVNRTLNGPFAASLSAVAVASAYGYAKTTGLDKRLVNAGSEFIRKNLS
jgi:hypothetical protein